MKTPNIPSGWRKLRKGERLKQGDKFKGGSNWFATEQAGCYVGSKSTRSNITNQPLLYIRRITKQKGAK